jgi:hypothetical protein
VTTNAVLTEVAPGVHRVQLTLPRRLRDARLFAFGVTHDAVVDLYGFTLFDRRPENN